MLALLGGTLLLPAQVAKTFYENGNLQSTVPLNEAGLLEGLGYTFYQTGELAMETRFQAGRREGEEREFYPDGTLLGVCSYVEDKREGWYLGYFENGQTKLRQYWQNGVKQGPMLVFFEDGGLHLFAQMEQDSTVFAQRFDEQGKLLNELLKPFSEPIDTAWIGEPVLELLTQQKTLIPGKPNAAKVYLPGVPTAYLSFHSPQGKIRANNDPAWPLLLVPEGKPPSFDLYLRIKTHPEAQAILTKQIRLGVE